MGLPERALPRAPAAASETPPPASSSPNSGDATSDGLAVVSGADEVLVG